jgi:uncharacterized protein YkwD
MYKKLSLILGLFAAFAFNLPAQNTPSQPASGPNVTTRLSDLETGLARYLESDEELPDPLARPRIVEIKAAAVKASVIVNTASVERIAFGILNQKRLEMGLQPLAWSDEIAVIARAHSQNMADFSFFSHRGLDSKMVSDRADANGLRKWRAIGENIAYNRGYKDPIEKAVQQWLDSAGHRRNLLDSSWKESAVGVAVAADGSYYFTQVFMKK